MPSNPNTLPSSKFQNNIRTVSGSYLVKDSDVVLNCNTSGGAVTIELALIPENLWSTQYKLYIIDYSGNAGTNNITINVPTGYKINGEDSQVISTNGQALYVYITSNTTYGITLYSNTPIANEIPVKNTVYVMKNGSDSTGLVERFDRPFLTIAGARTALLAFYTGGNAPSSTNRILIRVMSGNYNENIILDNYVDYDLSDIVLSQTTAGYLIGDNNVAVNSIISGNANLICTTTGGNPHAIYIQNASSNVTISVNDITMTGTGSTTIRGARSVGTLNLTFNNMTVTESSGNTMGIFADAGTIFAIAKGNIITTGTTLQNSIVASGAGAYCYFRGNDVTTNTSGNGAVAVNTISSQRDAKLYVICNNVYHIGSGSSAIQCGAIACAIDGPELYVKCNQIIVTPAVSNTVTCCQLGRSASTQTIGAKMYVECVNAIINAKGTSNNAIVTENCDSATVSTFKGKYQVVDSGGTNVDCVVNKTNSGSSGKLILDSTTLIAIGTGDAIATDGAIGNVYIYGSCQSNKAVQTVPAVTLLVGTVVNGRFIENDVNVI